MRTSKNGRALKCLLRDAQIESAVSPVYRLETAIFLIRDSLLSLADKFALHDILLAIEARVLELEAQLTTPGLN
jgi:hypothetical protein